MTAAKPIAQGRGRPRDPGLEERVFDAAIALYARTGWAGFTFEAVSRNAAVGKDALHRRWPSRGALLARTLQARWYKVEEIDTGSARGDLLALARTCFDAITGPLGRVALHLYADLDICGEFHIEIGPYGEPTKRAARLLIHRAIARGELPASADAGLVLDLVVGAVTNHVASAPPALKPAMLAKREAFLENLVDVVLAGFTAHGG